MKTSTFHQDGVTEIGFTLPLRTNKNSDKIYKTMVFEILDIKQCKTVIPEIWRQTRWTLWLLWLSALNEFPGHSSARGYPGRPQVTPWIEEQRWVSVTTGTYRKKKILKRRKREFQRSVECLHQEFSRRVTIHSINISTHKAVFLAWNTLFSDSY